MWNSQPGALTILLMAFVAGKVLADISTLKQLYAAESKAIVLHGKLAEIDVEIAHLKEQVVKCAHEFNSKYVPYEIPKRTSSMPKILKKLSTVPKIPLPRRPNDAFYYDDSVAEPSQTKKTRTSSRVTFI